MEAGCRLGFPQGSTASLKAGKLSGQPSIPRPAGLEDCSQQAAFSSL